MQEKIDNKGSSKQIEIFNKKIDITELDVKRILDAKFDVAGSSARFMFAMSTKKVIQDLHEAVERTQDPKSVVQGTTRYFVFVFCIFVWFCVLI